MATDILTHGRVTWTHIVRPTAEDIRDLAARYPQFHALNLQDCLTEVEFPKLDHHDDYLFLVVQAPLWDERRAGVHPAEVDIFIARGTLVTSHTGEMKPLVELFPRARDDELARDALMAEGASPLLHRVLDVLVDNSFPLVQRLEHAIRHVEDSLFDSDTRHILDEIARVRRDVIVTRRILHPQWVTIHQLEQGAWPFIHEELEPYWGDLSDHLAQLRWMLDEQIEVVNGLSDTIDTLASHRIDAVVRLLTVVTVLTLPLTLLATVFGMNVTLPYAEHPALFVVVVGAGVAVTLGLLWFIRQRRWL